MSVLSGRLSRLLIFNQHCDCFASTETVQSTQEFIQNNKYVEVFTARTFCDEADGKERDGGVLL